MKKTKVKKVKKVSQKKALREIEKHLPQAYRPITGWGYFLRGILYALPVLGWIIAWCKAAKAKNRNVANFARCIGTLDFFAMLAAIAFVVDKFAFDFLPFI